MTPQARHPVWPLSTAFMALTSDMAPMHKKNVTCLVTVFIRLPQGFFGELIWSAHGQAQRSASSQHAKVCTSWPFQRYPFLGMAKMFIFSSCVCGTATKILVHLQRHGFAVTTAGRVNHHATRITSESTKIRITKSKFKRQKSSPISWNLGEKHHYKCMDSKSFKVSEAHL